MSVVSSIQRIVNSVEEQVEAVCRDEGSVLGRTVHWLRAPDETDTTKTIRKVAAIAAGLLLTATVVGALVVYLAARTWKIQEQNRAGQPPAPIQQPEDEEEDTQPLPLDEEPLPAAEASTRQEVRALEVAPQPVAKADISLAQLAGFTFTDVAPEELLNRQSDVQSVNPKHPNVSLDELQQKGLLPSKKMVLGDATYYPSKTFTFEEHTVVIALVEIEEKLSPRIFYHSNSQGTWRVLPTATKIWQRGPFDLNIADGKRRITHFGKGQKEHDTELPIGLTMALNGLSITAAQASDFPAEQVIKTQAMLDPRNSFINRVQIEPAMFLAENAPDHFVNRGQIILRPPNPRDIQPPANLGLHPDFSTKVERSYKIAQYGQVKAVVVASYDKQLIYLFHEARDGRVYLAAVERVKDAMITTYGVRNKTAETSNMDSPLLEHRPQVAPGFEATDPMACLYESENYRSNWNYVRELAFIRDYYEKQGREVPPAI